MSAEELRRSGCVGKVAYDTWDSAHKVLKRHRISRKRRGAKRPGKVDVYRCRFCQKWHIGGSISGGGEELKAW